MGYDSVTVTKVMSIVDAKKHWAVKQQRQYEKMRNLGFLKWREPYYVSPESMCRIFTEVAEQMKELSTELSSQLQPTESTKKLHEYAAQMEQLDNLMKTEFPDFYEEGKKAKLSQPELIIYVLGRAVSEK